jgi:hypothetical protein
MYKNTPAVIANIYSLAVSSGERLAIMKKPIKEDVDVIEFNISIVQCVKPALNKTA